MWKKESQLQFTSLGGFNPHRPAGFCKKDWPGTSWTGPAAETLSYQMWPKLLSLDNSGEPKQKPSPRTFHRWVVNIIPNMSNGRCIIVIIYNNNNIIVIIPLILGIYFVYHNNHHHIHLGYHPMRSSNTGKTHILRAGHIAGRGCKVRFALNID